MATRKRESWDTGIARHSFYSSFGPFEARRRTTVLADPIYFQGLFSLPQLRSIAVSEKNLNKERCVHVAAPVADGKCRHAVTLRRMEARWSAPRELSRRKC